APLAVGRFRAAVVVGSAGTEGAARGSGVTRLVVTQPGAMRLVMMRPGIVRDLPVGFRSAPGVPNADRDPRGRSRSDDATTRRRHDATRRRRHEAQRCKAAEWHIIAPGAIGRATRQSTWASFSASQR